MGMSPAEVKSCSWWEFAAAMNGWVAANTPSKGNRLTEEEADALFEWIGGDNDNDPVQSPRYEAEFGERGFWIDGMKLRVVPGRPIA